MMTSAVSSADRRFFSHSGLGAILTVVVALAPAAAEAVVLTTTQSTAPSTADPVWGQGLTLNIGADLPDGSIPPFVNLDFVGLRTGDPTGGSPSDRTAVYLHVYDNFGINPDGSVNGAAIGNLIDVSTNTVDLEAAAPTTDVFWFFSGPLLSKSTTYHYILANTASAATSGDFSNLVYSEFVTAYGNVHTGGQHYRQTGDLGDGPTSGDLFFRVQSSFDPVPEPSTFVLGTLGLVTLGLAFRRKRRSSCRTIG